MTLDELKALRDSGEFHHATYRNHGTLWEGLFIYRKDPNGCRGFTLVGSFPAPNRVYREGQATSDDAWPLIGGTGVSMGSYGQG